MNTRRQFVKTSALGLGALAYHPYLNANPAKTGEFPKRFVFIRKGNGMMPTHFNLPTLPEDLKESAEPRKGVKSFEVALDQHELPDWLSALNDYKEHMSIIQGLSIKMCKIGHTSHASIMMASGSGENASGCVRTSVDFELAKLFPSSQGHIELSFASNKTGVVDGFSVPKPYKKNFCYADPISAYENLFKSVLSPKLIEQENSTLAYLKDDQSAFSEGRKGELKDGYENYIGAIDAVRNRNMEMTRMADRIARNLPDKKKVYSYGSKSSSLMQRQEVMTDILVSALVTGMTNVVTYTIDDLFTPYSGLPRLENEAVDLHAIGHNKGHAEFSSDFVRDLIRRQHVTQIRTIIDSLKAQPEGDGNMFDNTMIMYFPEAGDGHHGEGIKPPMFVMSGKNCALDIAGRYIRLPHYLEEGHQTIGNWYTTLLNAHGNPVKHYGNLDPNMNSKGLSQEGAIERFMRV